jgi:hypothetical protein
LKLQIDFNHVHPMTTPHRPCTHRSLASSRVCRIEQCDHGTLHLILGDLTLRVRPDELLELCRAFDLASLRMGGDGEGAGRRLS